MNRVQPSGPRLAGPVLMLAATIAAGTLGYVLIERWSVEDALYMTVIAVTTVGFGEIHPLSRAGRLFTIALILVGVGSLFYTFGSLMAFVFEGQLTQRWERRRMERQVAQLSASDFVSHVRSPPLHLRQQARRRPGRRPCPALDWPRPAAASG